MLPRLPTVDGHVHANTRRDVYLGEIERMDDRALYVMIHPCDDLEGQSIISALQETTLLDTDQQGVRIVGVEVQDNRREG